MKSGREEAARGSIPGSLPRPDREHRKPQPTTCYTVVCVKTAVEISEESPILTSPTEFRACVFSTLSHSRIRIYDHFSLDIAGPQLYTEAQSIEGVASAMRYIEDPRQEPLFDPYQGLFPPLARRILENGWQGTFRL